MHAGERWAVWGWLRWGPWRPALLQDAPQAGDHSDEQSPYSSLLRCGLIHAHGPHKTQGICCHAATALHDGAASVAVACGVTSR